MDTTTVAFSPNGQFILSAGFDGTIRFWEKDKCSLQAIVFIHDPRTYPGNSDSEYPAYQSLSRGILSLAWSPDGEKFAFGLRDRTVRLYSFDHIDNEIALFDEQVVYQDDYQLTVRAVAYSPDGRFIASGGHANHIILWDSEQEESSIRRFCCHNPGPDGLGVNALDFSPDGKFILSGSSDGTVKLWETHSGKNIRTIEVSSRVFAVAFSPDGSIMSGSTSPSSKKKSAIFLWNKETGYEERKLYHPGGSWSIRFSPDGRFLASGGYSDGKIMIWEVSTGKLMQTLTEPESRQIRSLDYSPDGRYIVSGVTSGPLPLWDVKTGKIVREFGKCPENLN